MRRRLRTEFCATFKGKPEKEIPRKEAKQKQSQEVEHLGRDML